jgi:sugar phosphate isomerase/epimerase
MPVDERLCGCSFIHPHRTLREGLELVQKLGFSFSDIGVGGNNGHYNPVLVAQSPIAFADEVQRETESLGIALSECFTLNFGTPINTPDSNQRQNTSRLFSGLCRFAQLAGCKSILLIPGPVHPQLGARVSLDLAVAALGNLVRIAGDCGVLLNIEADYESCANTPETADELCRRVPGLGLTLDYSHFIYQGIMQERVAILHQHARHVHVRQAAPGRIVAEADDGVIDYALVIKQLEDMGYKGLYCVECLSLRTEQSTPALSEKRTRAMKQEIQRHLQRLKAEL